MPVPAWAAGSARSRLRDGLLLALVSATYAAGTSLSFLLFQVSAIGPAFFPSAGVTLAALVLARRSLWPALVLTTAGTELMVDRVQGYDWVVAGGFAAANALEPLVGAWLLLGRDLRLDLSRAAHVVRFLLLGVLAGPLVGAAVGSATIQLDGVRPWAAAFGPWWSGDALGVLIVGGVILALARGGWADRPLRHRATLAIALGVVGWTVAIAFWSENWLAYLVLPILVLSAAWLGVRGVALAGAVTAGVAMVLTALERGPWAYLWALSPHGQLVQLQWFLLLILSTVWFLAGAVTGWRREERESRRATEAWTRAEHLNRLAAQLAAALTPRDIARAAVESGTSLVAPRGAVAWITSDGAGVRLLSSRHLAGGRTLTGPERVPMDAPLPMTEAIRTGRRVALDSPAETALRFPATAEEYRQGGTFSSLHVPLRSGQQTVGVLSVEFDEPGPVQRPVGTLVQTVADMVAQGLERARLYEEEREAGLTLQRALLPRQLPRLPGVRAAGRYRPGDSHLAIGGDWYDLIPLPDGRAGIVVGDVVGHGLQAAAVMGRLRSALAGIAPAARGPADALEQLDRFAAGVEGAELATVVYAEFDPAEGALRYACAGHPYPLLLDRNGQVRFLRGGRSTPLGVPTEGSRPEERVPVLPGSTVICYSDGLVERRTESITVSMERLATQVRRLGRQDPQALCDELLGAMTAGRQVTDDVVLLCVSLPGRQAVAALHHRLLADPAQLAPTRRMIRQWAGAHGIPDLRTERLLLASGEALANAMEHAYAGTGPGAIELVIRLDPDGTIVTQVHDFGTWREPDPAAVNGGGARLRGRGIPLMNGLMDRVEVVRQAAGTTVTMTDQDGDA